MRSTRMRRTDDLVRRVIAEALLTKVQDPRIGFVSVTGVRVSREFDTAKVFVSVLGDEAERVETMKGLKRAAPYLQSELARAIRMRRTPRLRFLYDDSVDRGFRVDEELRRLEARAGDGLDAAKESSDEDGLDAPKESSGEGGLEAPKESGGDEAEDR